MTLLFNLISKNRTFLNPVFVQESSRDICLEKSRAVEQTMGARLIKGSRLRLTQQIQSRSIMGKPLFPGLSITYRHLEGNEGLD